MSLTSKCSALQHVLKISPHPLLEIALKHWLPKSMRPSVEGVQQEALPLFFLALQLEDQPLLDLCSTLIPTKVNVDILKLELSIHSQPSLSIAAHLRNYFHPSPAVFSVFHSHRPSKILLRHVPPNRYQHPEELELIKEMGHPPFEALARTLSAEFTERSFQIRNNGSAILVSKGQFPELHKQFIELCHLMGLSITPDLFVAHGPLNAYTSGTEAPFIVIHDSVLLLPRDEIDFILGHELGHIGFDHMLLHMIAQASILHRIAFAPSLILSRLLGKGLQHNLRKWVRSAELSCDRAGLLACQNPEAAIRVMLRFAGTPQSLLHQINIDELIEQSQTVERKSQGIMGYLLHDGDRSHPWIIERIKALQEWITCGDYLITLQTPVPKLSTLSVQWPKEFPQKIIRAQSLLKETIRTIKENYRKEFIMADSLARRYELRTKLEGQISALCLSIESQLKTKSTAPSLKLNRRSTVNHISAFGEASSLTMGLFLFPTAPLWVSALGIGIGVSGFRDAEKKQLKREQELQWAHFEAVDLWLCDCDDLIANELSQL